MMGPGESERMPVLAATHPVEVGSATVVATLRMPLPITDDLVKATAALERLYGQELYLVPTRAGDEFVKIATRS